MLEERKCFLTRQIFLLLFFRFLLVFSPSGSIPTTFSDYQNTDGHKTQKNLPGNTLKLT